MPTADRYDVLIMAPGWPDWRSRANSFSTPQTDPASRQADRVPAGQAEGRRGDRATIRLLLCEGA